MAEGDTIFRAAAKLRDSIAGQVIRAADTGETLAAQASTGQPLRPVAPAVAAIRPETLAGQTVTSIEARGKHLLMQLDDGRVLHSHMGMDGSWHIYSPGQPWQKPARHADLVLQFDHVIAVCFLPKVLELLTAAELQRHRWLTRLGPDLLANEVDVDEVIGRFRRRNELPIGEAVMNQSIVSGIGNVYKSELLFLDQLHPLTRVADVSDEKLASLITRARKLLQRNVHGEPRRTRFRGDGHSKWVYGRAGEACLKCGETIRLTRQGDLGRTTYYCPRCQQR